MPVRRSGKNAVYWKNQLPIDYIDTSLVINTWENVSSDLSGGKPARLWQILVEQTNNGATAEDIELEITINGTAYTFTRSCDSGAVYYAAITHILNAGDFATQLNASAVTVGHGNLGVQYAIPFDADKIGLIRVRQTSAVDGTAAQIEINIVWEKLVGV